METMAPARLPKATSDTGTKRPRTFQCRELLWEGVEQMAGELECTVDFLINDALKHYLRDRQRLPPLAPPSIAPSRPVDRPTPPGQPLTPRSQFQPLAPPPMPQPVFGPPPPPPPNAQPPRPPPFVGGQTIALPLPIPAAPPPLPPMPPPGFVPPPPGFATPMSVSAPRPPPPMPPPSFRGAPPPPPPMPPMPARLTVTYGNQTREVEGPGFIIGRGKQAVGLTIKDPNISRSHATIEWQDGVYYLVDMGSTNGTLVNGAPIQRKPIMEGDVARICDHEIRFSYRRPV